MSTTDINEATRETGINVHFNLFNTVNGGLAHLEKKFLVGSCHFV